LLTQKTARDASVPQRGKWEVPQDVDWLGGFADHVRRFEKLDPFEIVSSQNWNWAL
jgi:hypothetical protein